MPRNSSKKALASANMEVAPHQKRISHAMNKTRVLDQQDPVDKTLAQDYSFVADIDEHGQATRHVIRLGLTCSTAAVQLGPLTQYFDQIQCYYGNDAKSAFRTYRGDELFILDGVGHALRNDHRAREDTNFWGVRGNDGEYLSVGETRDFYITLPAFPLQGMSEAASGKYKMKFTLRKGCVLSGSASNVAVLVRDSPVREGHGLDASWCRG